MNKVKDKVDKVCCAESAQRDIKSYVMIGLVAVLLVISVVQSFQITALSKVHNVLSSNVVTGAASTATGDTSGWTENEKMMYEHHGTLPARLQGNSNTQNTQLPSMIGGC